MNPSKLGQTSESSSIKDAIEAVCAGHFHQCLWIPETPEHGKLRITFSTTSNFEDMSLPTILFCAPLFGSRWASLEVDCLARSMGVRVINVDRYVSYRVCILASRRLEIVLTHRSPGMGGSTRVSLNLRMQTWREIVPLLLERLRVKRVSLVCHSAGAIYALDTLYHLRGILDPSMPYVALIGK